MILFTDFCAWALEHALDLDEEDDWQPATPATGASTGSALAGSAAAPEAPAVLSGGGGGGGGGDGAAPQRHAVGSAVSAAEVRDVQAEGGECSGGGECSNGGGAASAGCSSTCSSSAGGSAEAEHAEAEHAAFSAAVSEAVQLRASHPRPIPNPYPYPHPYPYPKQVQLRVSQPLEWIATALLRPARPAERWVGIDRWVSRATRLARYTVPRCWAPQSPDTMSTHLPGLLLGRRPRLVPQSTRHTFSCKSTCSGRWARPGPRAPWRPTLRSACRRCRSSPGRCSRARPWSRRPGTRSSRVSTSA